MSDLTCTTHKLLHATNLGVQKGDQQVANGKVQACLTLMSVAELYIVVLYQMRCHHNSLSQHNVICKAVPALVSRQAFTISKQHC